MSRANGNGKQAPREDPDLVGLRVALAAAGTVELVPLPEGGGYFATLAGWEMAWCGDTPKDVLRSMWKRVRPHVEAHRARLRREAEAREKAPGGDGVAGPAGDEGGRGR